MKDGDGVSLSHFANYTFGSPSVSRLWDHLIALSEGKGDL